jgi:hypothetical protein
MSQRWVPFPARDSLKMTRRRGVVTRLRAEGWILVSASIGRYRKLGIQTAMDTLIHLRGMCGNEHKSLFLSHI